MNRLQSGAFALLALASSSLSGATYRISGPHIHENLSVFLIHGENQSPRHYLTFQEALAQKKVVVYETGNVNTLAVENVSGDDVYIQSGDIVKGGQQDRTMKDDIILTSHSGKIPISAFCVEHGRWSRRGTESVHQFDAAPAMVSTRELKKAVRLEADQAQVWAQVAGAQEKLARSMSAPMGAPASPSSMMLTLENKKLQGSVDDYIKSLSGIVDKNNDVIGFAFAVNGKLSSADIYGSNELFRKLWPKLLRASAVEAVAELRSGEKPAGAPTKDDIRTALLEGGRGRVSESNPTPRTAVKKKETDKEAVFDTLDRSSGESLVHRSYLSK